ncbi:MAG TPA: polyprenol monophosphomannose synthase, partial [Candidatus Paceibacterota bacterium]|nr:polyprenol monophosphomannose synthase [Candidatus Paceibacterota bacterium]
DLSHDPDILPSMLASLAGHDVVLGSRYVNGGEISNWNLYRKLLSRFANWYVRIILSIPYHDLTTGFVAYSSKAIRSILNARPESEGYAFLVETKYIAFENNCSMMEIPIIFKEREYGSSKMSLRIIGESIILPWKLKTSRL